ncbi:MAG: arginine--tRNA ligase [Elusimicrobia bacterium]|nr:arginine--tRNA ligase [Elusimicrobiota bacterium]
MVFHKLRLLLRTALAPWAKEHGLALPEEFPLAPIPAHLKGDVSLSWPLKISKELKKNPLEISQKLAVLLDKAAQGFASVEACPPGFDNFTFQISSLVENLKTLLNNPAEYGRQEKAQDSFLIEFVSANPTGPLHLAHGRAATLGDSLARILKLLGHKVSTEFYVNDMGTQVDLLGKSLQARKQDRLPPEKGYLGENIREAAQKFPEESKNWSAEEWAQAGIRYFMELQRSDLDAFEVHFDRWFRESDLHQKNALEETLNYLKQNGMAYEKDGAVWFGSSSQGEDDKDRVLIRSDKRPTYFLPDIAYHRDKLRRGYRKLVTIWGADHHGYVPRMRAAIGALGHPDAFQPIVHQLVHLTRGNVVVKMSKRAGEFVTLHELMEEVGKDACRFFFAMRSPNSHLNFDLELAKKKSQENPVYTVQYVHARICSIFREAQKKNLVMIPSPHPLPQGEREKSLELGTWNLEVLKETEERALLVRLAWFPEVLKTCATDLSPHHLTTYLMDLAGLFNPFYEKHRVVDEGNAELSKARLALCEGTRLLIEKGLELLGVSSPTQM